MCPEFPALCLGDFARSAAYRESIMTTWEYLTTPLLIHNTAAILNNWGKQGWELVQVVTNAEGGLVAYMKRPVGDASTGNDAGLAAAAAAAKQFEGGQA